MTSFTPGNKSYAKRMINYNAVYNKLNANSLNYNLQPQKNCECIPEIFNKNLNSSSSYASTNLSYSTRVAQIINSSLVNSTGIIGKPVKVFLTYEE